MYNSQRRQNYHWTGVGEARPEGPRAGDGVIEEGQPAPPHHIGGFAGAL